MNNTNVLELWYLTDVDVSSYTGHYDMQIAYLSFKVSFQSRAGSNYIIVIDYSKIV